MSSLLNNEEDHQYLSEDDDSIFNDDNDDECINNFFLHGALENGKGVKKGRPNGNMTESHGTLELSTNWFPY